VNKVVGLYIGIEPYVHWAASSMPIRKRLTYSWQFSVKLSEAVRSRCSHH